MCVYKFDCLHFTQDFSQQGSKLDITWHSQLSCNFSEKQNVLSRF